MEFHDDEKWANRKESKQVVWAIEKGTHGGEPAHDSGWASQSFEHEPGPYAGRETINLGQEDPFLAPLTVTY